MDTNEIKELIKLIEQSAIEEFEMERDGVRIRVRKSLGMAAQPQSPAPSAAPQAAAPQPEEAAEPEKDESIHIFTSPIIGTFYRAPKPDADPFVEENDKVKEGTVLCIVEAMKIMNQIECDVSGVIEKVLVDNGQPVEYGEPLFEIRLT
ncbi:MAG TPA: acetyl-CoA carboxylase biotin carboxyl carrier protein [Acidobacteriota bacterium]|nr:acetyl-CoA carboxylase biotin carboxyl carrier protein [Acidobacteriota bacterium]